MMKRLFGILALGASHESDVHHAKQTFRELLRHLQIVHALNRLETRKSFGLTWKRGSKR